MPPFPKRSDPPADVAAVQRAAWEAGETTQAAVARAFGCSPAWAGSYIEREGWKKPARAKAPKAKAAAKKPATRKPRRAARGRASVGHEDIMQRLAARALRLMDLLERRLGAEDISDEHMRLMTSLVKMLAEFQKSGIARGDSATNGDANGCAGADPAESAGDLARARSDLAARIAAAIAAHAGDDTSGGERSATD